MISGFPMSHDQQNQHEGAETEPAINTAIDGSIQSDPLPATMGRRGRQQDEAPTLPTGNETILDPLIDRSFDLPPRFHPRRRRPRNASGTSTDEFPSSSQDLHEQPNQPSSSFAQSALNGTFGLLRQVGGVTLSTTGALVAPPLHVTRRVLLPQLWALFVDMWESNAPQRVKDWFKIFQSSIYHIVHTLRNTSAGHTVRTRWLIVWQDLIDILSTDLTRQALIDTAGSLVKFSEALNTDEAKACFDQIAITMTRILDVLSNPRCRLFIHDWRQAVASVATLLADPVATTALAEVTAYLCYALEREHRQQDNQSRRHQYHISIHQNRDTVNQHPTMTVEEAILSSLDPTPINVTAAENQHANKDLPWDTASSIRNQVEQEDVADCSVDWYDKARRNIDVQYLREMIEERAMERQSQAMEDLVMNPSDDDTSPAASRQRVQVETVSEDESREHNVVTFTTEAELKSPERKERTLRFDGEAPIDQFERILNDILKERRLGDIPSSRRTTDSSDKEVPVATTPRRSKLKGAGGRLTLLVGIGLVLGIGTLWFGFGCFGVYLYWTHYHQRPTKAGSSWQDQEIVVRVVREVVHVDAKGKVLGRGMSPPHVATADDYEKVASCVADAYKN